MHYTALDDSRSLKPLISMWLAQAATPAVVPPASAATAPVTSADPSSDVSDGNSAGRVREIDGNVVDMETGEICG